MRVSVLADAAGATLRVIDHGIGISPELISGLFEPFRRLSENVQTPGLGLGLHVCRLIVEEHGGRIRLESDGPQLGSTAEVWLPRFSSHSGRPMSE